MLVLKRLAKCGMLIAIPIFLVLMASSGPAEACGGANSTEYSMDKKMSAPAGEYVVKEFEVKGGETIDIDGNGGVVYILNETEMENYRSGGNFTPWKKIDNDSYNGDMGSVEGRFFSVLDNTDGTTKVTSKVQIYHRYKCGPEDDGLFPTPGFELGMGALAMMVIAMALVLKVRA